jgi:drug/metabolite transporter (DMT)-like permease
VRVRAQLDRQPAAIVALSVAMMAWGLSGVVAKGAAMGPVALAAYRTAVATLMLAAILAVRRRRITRAMVWAALPGGIFMGLDLMLFFTAVKLTTVANATVIGALQPALMIFISGPLLHERVAPRAARWAGLCIVGTAIVVFGASGLPQWSLKGDGLAFLTLFAWTAYFISSRRARRQMDAMEYSAITAGVATLIAWPYAALAGQDLSWPSARSWMAIVGLAIGAGLLGHFLMSVSIPHLPLWISSMMTLAIPVVSTAAAAAFLHEPVTALQIGGMALVLVALALAIRSSDMRADDLEPAPTG